MLEKIRQHYIKRTRGQWFVSFVAVTLIAALIAVSGSWYIILKGPYTAYRQTFVRNICENTHLDFAVRLIIGEEEMNSLLSDGEEASEQ